MEISTVKELMQSLREGKYTSAGGYPKYWLCDDGAALSYEAMIAEIWLVARAVRDRYRNGWRVVGWDINWEDPDLYCSHTGERIPSAYAEAESAATVKFAVRYIHKISPRPSSKDFGLDVDLSDEDRSCVKRLGRALREKKVLVPGTRVRSFRSEGSSLVVFPDRGIWHSVILTPKE